MHKDHGPLRTNPKKICVFTTVHRPFDVRVFHREARTLAEAGYEVVLLVHADFKIHLASGVHFKGIPRARNRFFRLLNIFRFAKYCLRENADAYHFHDLELLPVGVLLKWLTRKPVIYDCHENYPEAALERVWYPNWIKPLLSRLIAVFEPLLAKQLDTVICVVMDQQERFEKKGCRTVLIRNVPRLELFDLALAQNLPRRKRLIYLGGITRVRGAEVLIRIMSELRTTFPEYKLLLLGPFNEASVEKDIKQMIIQNQLTEHIEHIPFVPHEQVAEYLVQSHIGLIPWQIHEQMLKMIFPNKVLEYMACALPIVASDLPSLKKIIEESGAGITVKAEDVSQYVAVIRTLLQNPEISQTLGRRGREFVQQHYNWNRESVILLQLYQSFWLPSSGRP